MKLIIIIFLILNIFVSAQSGYKLEWRGSEMGGKLEDFQEVKGGLNGYLQKAKNHLLSEGYLAASIDKIEVSDSLKLVTVELFLGEEVKFSSVDFNKQASEVLTEMEGEDRWVDGLKRNPNLLESKLNKIIIYCENNGYPFAQITIDSAVITAVEIKVKFILTKGPLIKFTDPTFSGIAENSRKLVNSLFGIEAGRLYDQRLINRLSKRINEISFWKFTKDPEYEIVNSNCTVFLYLGKKNANSFNAILGLLPKSPKGFNITGDVRIKLVNQLNQGELIDVNWRKLLPLTQNLDLHFKYPFMFGTDFGSDISFDLYKKDTSFLDLNTKLALEYFLSNQITFSTFYHNKTANLLSADKYINATVLPSFADIKVNNYGIGFKFQNLNSLLNPSRGWIIDVETTVGSKIIRKNALLPEELYDNLTLKSIQYGVRGKLSKFNQLTRRNTLLTELGGGYIANASLFENELYRLGGLRTIRGFDDESIFASNYVLATLEYRFLLDEFSNLFCFGQWMSYDKNIKDSFVTDNPYSVGIGINFQTNTGIFNLSYAVGSERNNPLLLRSAKIHVGFVNYF
ncbi:MAG: outer membrane protein assembly factor BamA [Parvicella sp.]|jgi:outer membrane protein assembly factor BamA